MWKIVLDTNCLLQVLSRYSPYEVVWDYFMKGEITLCISNEILCEYIEILQRLANPRAVKFVTKALTSGPHTLYVDPYYHFGLITADPDDNKFVDCAIADSARCIVSNDRHFDVLRHIAFPHVEVQTLKAFCEELEAKR